VDLAVVFGGDRASHLLAEGLFLRLKDRISLQRDDPTHPGDSDASGPIDPTRRRSAGPLLPQTSTVAMSRELVSAVIPAYNYGRFVTLAVDSALAQTYPNMEVIVVDDGSKDDTRERLAPYGDRIRYIYQENGGLSAARNTGIRHARGEWVALLDADDLWHPEKIETQLRAIAGRGSFALIGSPSAAEMPDRLEPAPEVRTLGVRDFLTASLFGPSSALIRRDRCGEVGPFDEGLKCVEDRDMWLRIAVRFPVALVLSPCWWYRLHPNQMNKNPGGMYAAYREVLAKFFEAHPEHAMLRDLAWGYCYFDAASSHLEAGRRRAAIGLTLRSLGRWPTAFGDRRIYQHQPWLRAKMLARLLMGDRAFRLVRPMREPQPCTAR
jgi:glycosyltransferase involved in cell wall biosynthesis